MRGWTKMLNKTQLAGTLGVSRMTVHMWAAAGMPFVRVGNRDYISFEDAQRWLEVADHRTPVEYREQKRDAFRERYSRNTEVERARTAAYKSRNVQRKNEWQALRNERIRTTSDGTATAKAIAALKAKTSECHYCHALMTLTRSRLIMSSRSAPAVRIR